MLFALSPRSAADRDGLGSSPAPGVGVAVFVARENLNVLQETLRCLCAALPEPAVVDILVNGNAGLVSEVRAQPAARWLGSPHVLRCWDIALADKANAWNEYLHQIWPHSSATYFVDGYVRLHPDALGNLQAALNERPQAMGATGVPSGTPGAGRMARDLLERGGLHGNLFALRHTTMVAMRNLQFRLPVGLYRTDSTIGSAMGFGLNPAQQTWDIRHFVALAPKATWTVDSGPLLSWNEVRVRFRRRLRQAQGNLENWAVRYHWQIERHPIGCLEPTVEELIQRWSERDPIGFLDKLNEHPLHRWAWRRILRSMPATRASGQACPVPLL